jgi:hypothetical protein
MALQPLIGSWSLFSFFIYTQSVELLGRGISHPKAAASAHRTIRTQNKHIHISIQVGFETTTKVFERAKRVHALDRAAIVVDTFYLHIF